MAQFPRVVFLSYVHNDNKQDADFLSKVRDKLEGELEMLSGESFTVFQDKVHIHTGHRWEDRISQYLAGSSLILPIVTPAYFNSEWCRRELDYFIARERQIGKGPLVLPVYYVESEKMDYPRRWPDDHKVQALSAYQFADWRKVRGMAINSRSVKQQVNRLATHILSSLRQLESSTLTDGNSPVPGWPGTAAPAWMTLRDGPKDRGAPFDLTMLQRARPFVGRNSELAWAIECLKDRERIRVVAFNGAQGIGKTACAAEIVRLLHEDAWFRDGVAVVRCHRMRDHIQILRDVLTRFDPQRRTPSARDDPGLGYVAGDLLTGKDALIVLDDVEPTLDIVRVIGPLHRAGAALLLTSRHTLPLPDHVTRTLDALPDAELRDLLTDTLERRPRDDESD